MRNINHVKSKFHPVIWSIFPIRYDWINSKIKITTDHFLKLKFINRRTDRIPMRNPDFLNEFQNHSSRDLLNRQMKIESERTTNKIFQRRSLSPAKICYTTVRHQRRSSQKLYRIQPLLEQYRMLFPIRLVNFSIKDSIRLLKQIVVSKTWRDEFKFFSHRIKSNLRSTRK